MSGIIDVTVTERVGAVTHKIDDQHLDKVIYDTQAVEDESCFNLVLTADDTEYVSDFDEIDLNGKVYTISNDDGNYVFTETQLTSNTSAVASYVATGNTVEINNVSYSIAKRLARQNIINRNIDDSLSVQFADVLS